MRITCCLLAVFFLMGSNCSQSPQFLSTQLDHISAASLVTCDPYGKPEGAPALSQRTCLVIANPFNPFLRVYDVSQIQFLLSPTGYSRLAVRANGMTTQLSSYDTTDNAFVFALDANLRKVATINARNSVNGSDSFSGALPGLLALEDKPLKTFVANPKGPGAPQMLAIYRDGTIQTSLYDVVVSRFGALDPQPTSLVATVADAVYDADTGLVALLTTANGQNDVVIRKAVDANPNTATLTLANVGNVKLGLGLFKSTATAMPHVLLMKQDEARLRTVRFDATTLVSGPGDDNTIKLSDVVVAAYIPTGADKQALANGTKDWVSVGADDGTFFYLPTIDLFSTADKIFTTTLSVAKTVNMPPKALSGLTQILGGDVIVLGAGEAPKDRAVCFRQMFFVFSSGFASSICEGNLNLPTLIIARDVAAGT
jgi:hypothetical protein